MIKRFTSILALWLPCYLLGANITPVKIDSLNSHIYTLCEIPKCLDEKIEAFSSLIEISKEWREKEFLILKNEFRALESKKHIDRLDLTKIHHFIQFGENEQAIKIAKSYLIDPNLDIIFKARVHNILGIAYQKIGDFTNAMQHYLTSEKLFIQNDSELSATYPLGNIADIYLQIGELDKALEKNLQAFQLSKELIGEKRYYNTGWDLIRIAEILILQKKYSEAHEKINSAREIIALCSDQELKAKSLSVIFDFFTATENFNEAAIIQDQIQCEYPNQINEGTRLFAEHRIRELKFLIGSKELAVASNLVNNTKIEQLSERKISYLKTKRKLYEALNDQKKIAELNQKISNHLEQNFKTEINKYLNVLEENYSIHSLHQENHLLRTESKKQRSVINFVLLLVLAFLITSILLASMFEKIKTRNKQLAQMNKSISQKNNELQQLNYTTTHDIKEPLNTIYHFTNLLQNKHGESLDPDASKLLSIINKASKDSQEQISGIQEYLRLGTGEITTFSVDQMMKRLLVDLEEVIRNNNAKITFKELPNIQGKETEIKSLFNNLILNAIHHSKPNKNIEIEISYAENESYHLFNIIDNGIGISKEYQEKIFDLFQVLDTKKNKPRKGTGLANSKKIVEVHQGEIWVNSKVGVGSTFSFTIKKELT